MFSRTFVFGDQVWPIVGQPVFALRATPGTLRLFSCVAAPREAQRAKRGGARRDRTDDLMLAKHALSQLSYGPVTRRRMLHSHVEPKFASTGPPSQALRRGSLRSRWPAEPEAAEQRRLVGLGRLELPTSRLSSARSNQLSYKPLTLSLENKDQGLARANWRLKRRMQSHKRLAPGACSSAKKEKRRRRNPAYGAQQS